MVCTSAKLGIIRQCKRALELAQKATEQENKNDEESGLLGSDQ